jgi:hypothetical protein
MLCAVTKTVSSSLAGAVMVSGPLRPSKVSRWMSFGVMSSLTLKSSWPLADPVMLMVMVMLSSSPMIESNFGTAPWNAS